MKASDLFVKCLENEDVEYIFGLPGEENSDFCISLLDSKIKFVLVRHEQSAAFMADVYGRITPKVGVCLATLGPGATNLTTGIANANMDRSRVLAITGQTDSHLLHKESHQNMDAITLFKPITKWNWSIRNTDNIPEIVRRAFKISLEEKSGATHIELPQDVAKRQSEIKPLKTRQLIRPKPHSTLVKKAAKLILDSQKPLILVGNGCIRESASAPIRLFAEKTGICSMNTFMAKGVISDRSERHLQTIGIKQADHSLIAMKDADLVIAIGYDLVEYSPKNWNSDLKKKIIHIDFTPAEVDTYYPPEVEIDADVQYTIEAILEELENEKKENTTINYPKKNIPESFKQIKQQIVDRIERHKNDDSFPIQPEKLVYDVRTSLNDRDIVVSDVGAHKMWIAKTYNTFEPNTCLIPNGFCSMGFSVPGAIASQLVFPERKIVAMCGDGSFLMNVQEIETAARLHLPIIVIVWCDGGYGLITLKEMDEYGKDAFTRFNNPDFVKLAQSFGAIGYKVNSSQEFPKILEEAKKSKDKPVIIAVDVDYSRNKLLLHDDFEK